MNSSCVLQTSLKHQFNYENDNVILWVQKKLRVEQAMMVSIR